MTKDFSGALKFINKYKYLMLVVLVGVVIILLPTGKGAEKTEAGSAEGISPPSFSLEEEEKRLREALRDMEGVGEVKVMLSLRGGVERELVPGEDGALVLSAGSGGQRAVESRFIYPEYLGAVIVCEGADRPSVRLDVTRAVQSVTGLGSDKIAVIKMKKS